MQPSAYYDKTKWCAYTETSQKSAHSDERPIQERIGQHGGARNHFKVRWLKYQS